ncbi:FIG00732551: hypothetical protein [Klebsiella pneumoniae IS46]|nr:FIG00732551: hypothetical protein [Klebsiella pneumoniae IS46]
MEFHENRARQPFIGFVLLVRFIKKWWLQGQNAQSFAANERRTAERYRPASGPDQLKRAVFYRQTFFIIPVSAKCRRDTFTKFIN